MRQLGGAIECRAGACGDISRAWRGSRDRGVGRVRGMGQAGCAPSRSRGTPRLPGRGCNASRTRGTMSSSLERFATPIGTVQQLSRWRPSATSPRAPQGVLGRLMGRGTRGPPGVTAEQRHFSGEQGQSRRENPARAGVAPSPGHAAVTRRQSAVTPVPFA